MSQSFEQQPKRHRGLKWLVASVVIATTAAVSLSAVAQHGPGRGPGPGGFGGPGLFMGPPEHAARAVDHMLKGLDATDAQKAQITQIVQAAGADIKSQRDTERALHDRGLQIFTAPTVDPAQAESVRQQLLAQHDTASRRVLQAMLDISRVLTPDQRAKIGARITAREAEMKARFARHSASAP